MVNENLTSHLKSPFPHYRAAERRKQERDGDANEAGSWPAFERNQLHVFEKKQRGSRGPWFLSDFPLEERPSW